MFRNYLGPAFARIAKAPFTSVANILTLALGLACFIAAFGIATFWQSADNYHAKARHTFFLTQSNTYPGMPPMAQNSMTNWSLEKYLRIDYPEMSQIARAMPNTEMAVAAGANKLMLNQAAVDPEFLTIFDLDFISGDPRTALSTPNSVVLTEETAQRLFGATPALGKSVLIDGKDDVTVTGVIRTIRQPSFMGSGEDAALRFDYLRHWASSPQGAGLDGLEARFKSLLGVQPITFFVLPDNVSLDAFNAKLPAFVERRFPAEDRARAKITLKAFPLADLKTFNLDRSLFASSGVNTSAVGALLALAALTLVIACVNYANLATAQAGGRAKEVGMRRVLGAGMLGVMGQAWTEAIVLAGIAAVLALGVLVFVAPVIKASMGIDLLYFLSGGFAGFGVVAGLVVLVAFFAGAYPALVLSRVRPAAALQSGKSRSGSKFMTRMLVAIQFASAGFLLILVTVTQLQRNHLEQSVLAPRGSPVIVLNDLMRAGIDYNTLEQRLTSQPGIDLVSVADIPPWSKSSTGSGFTRTANTSAAPVMGLVKSVGDNYHKAFNLPVLAGRTFDRAQDRPFSLLAFNTPPFLGAVIDRQMSEALGFAAPEAAVGQTIYIPASMTGLAAKAIHIIGVTETETTIIESMRGGGTVYGYAPKALWGEQRPIIRVAPGKVAAAVDSINRVFEEIAPNIPAQIRFYDQQFEQSYAQYGRISQLFILLASTAFAIASIGLLGIAVHVAAKRRHEIAVRKTLGSSAIRVVRLLLTDFSQPVLIGNLIAWPLAWLASETYLRAFSSRIELSPAPFIISLAITLAIAWGATIGVVLRAATQRPADVLRRA